MAPRAATPTTPASTLDLRIDWLEPAQLGDELPGRLGLTILPGKRGVSFRYPGPRLPP